VSAPAKTQALEALVEAHARELHLPAIRTRFRGLAAEAVREQQTPLAYLAALLEAEVTERSERREKRRLLDARFPIIKRLEDFRFADNPKVPQATIAALAQGSWIDDRESIILIGESGTGKTMLATALGVCACQQGRRVRFTTLAGLATELQEADSRRELARVIGRYSRIDALVLDELGYLALPDGAAELVFQVISERNERGSLIVTTNLPFGEWKLLCQAPSFQDGGARPPIAVKGCRYAARFARPCRATLDCAAAARGWAARRAGRGVRRGRGSCDGG
jgi:DNA replication protein DnaC